MPHWASFELRRSPDLANHFRLKPSFSGGRGGILDYGDLVHRDFLGEGSVELLDFIHVRLGNPGIVFGFCGVFIIL